MRTSLIVEGRKPYMPACPIATDPLGGIPDEGVYGHATAYEYGAGRIVESLRRILGGLHRAYPEFAANLKIAAIQATDEALLILDTVDAYSKENHTRHFLSGGDFSMDVRTRIIEVSTNLVTAAAKSTMGLSRGLPDPILRTAKTCYCLAYVLADTMAESVKFHPAVVNGFQSPTLMRTSKELWKNASILTESCGKRAT